jgi:hypothetical protein
VDGRRVAVVDIAHEALIRHWPQLQTWIQDNREALVKQRLIEQAAQDWQHHGQASSYLLSGGKLAEAEQYYRQYTPVPGLSTLAQTLLLKSRHRRRRNQAAALALTVGLSSLVMFTLRQFSERRFQEQYAAVLVGSETSPQLIPVLSKALKTAQRQADKGKIPAALESYKALLTATHRFNQAAQGEAEGFQAGDRQIIQTTTQQAEADLANLLAQQYLPTIAQQLAQPQVGHLIEGTRLTDFEDQYSEGALRSTYSLLMGKSGLKADINDNGELDLAESVLIPCPTLVELEKLWRDATDNRCGFLAADDPYFDDSCQELSGHTLTERIFSRSESFIERAALCGLPGARP